MSNLLTQALVVDKYGFRVGVDKLAEILCITKPAVYNQLSAGTFPIPTYLDQGKRYADFRDVAAHLDQCRELATRGASSQALAAHNA